MTTRKTFQRPSRHVLRMALLAVSPWFAGSDILAQGPASQPNLARPTTPRDGINAVAKPQQQANPQNSAQQQFTLPPPVQAQNLPPAATTSAQGNVNARLQVYDVPLEYVGEVGAMIQAQFGKIERQFTRGNHGRYT